MFMVRDRVRVRVRDKITVRNDARNRVRMRIRMRTKSGLRVWAKVGLGFDPRPDAKSRIPQKRAAQCVHDARKACADT